MPDDDMNIVKALRILADCEKRERRRKERVERFKRFLARIPRYLGLGKNRDGIDVRSDSSIIDT